MKKYLIFFICSLFALSVFGQESECSSEEIVATNNSKEVMWINLKKWISSNFNKYNYVVDVEDKESGTMIVKWNSLVPNTSPDLSTSVGGSVQIDVKDKKYRVRTNNGSVSIDIIERNYADLSTRTLRQIESDFDLITDNCSGEEFPVTELLPILKNQKDILDSTVKYKNEANKMKNKVTSSYKKAERNYNIFNDMLSGYKNVTAYLISSLKEAMTINDDF